MVKSLAPSLDMAHMGLGGRAALADGHSGQRFSGQRFLGQRFDVLERQVTGHDGDGDRELAGRRTGAQR